MKNLILLLCITLSFSIFSQQLAFPEAVGFGRYSEGGRGGRVIFVTNTNDSGAGSFRAAAEDSTGPRIIIPRVGGRVEVSSNIQITDPYLTYYGHAAPGDGLMFTKDGQEQPLIEIKTHDVVFRFLKARYCVNYPGYANADALRVIGSNAYDVMLDHCSISWSPDGNLDITEGAHNVTVQYSILHQALSQEKNSLNKYQVHSLSYFSNLLSSTAQRNPAIASNSISSYFPDDPNMNPEFEVVNNVIFRFQYATTFPREYASKLNWINNRLLFDGNKRRGLFSSSFNTIDEVNPEDRVQIYMRGNTDDKWRTTITSPVDWEEEFSLSQGTSGSGYEDDPPDGWVEGTDGIYYRIPPQFRTFTPHNTPIISQGVSLSDAGVEYNEILWNNIKGTLGSYLPTRDAVDTEIVSIIDDYVTDYDKNRISAAYPKKDDSGENTFPTINNGTPFTDSNQNGIPDDWESANMGGDSANDLAPSGYTWIEEYYNILAGSVAVNGPVITRTDNNPTTIQLGGTYKPPTGTWTDVEDGSGIATVSGDTVDVNTEGVYYVLLEHSDSDGNKGSLTIPYTVTSVVAPSNGTKKLKLYFISG